MVSGSAPSSSGDPQTFLRSAAPTTAIYTSGYFNIYLQNPSKLIINSLLKLNLHLVIDLSHFVHSNK